MSGHFPSEKHAGGQYSQPLEGCQPHWRAQVDRLKRTFEGLLWPSRCVLCLAGTKEDDLCPACARDLPFNLNACRRCALPLAEGAVDLICGACAQSTPGFDLSFAPFRYAYPLDRMIQRLKYAQQLHIGRMLARCFAQQLMMNHSVSLPSAIVPVPLGRTRYLSRGYNQAIELAMHLRRHLNVPVRADWVVRERETAEQAGLARRERRKNVRGAFALSRQPDCAHVAILDDVVTTGSTVNEVASVLREAGVSRIEVWAIARAGR